MKISIVIAEGCKQVMLTPETEHEKQAIKFIAPDDVLKGVSKIGTFDNEPRYPNEQVAMCQGGYLRRFADKESLMFVIEDNKVTPPPAGH